MLPGHVLHAHADIETGHILSRSGPTVSQLDMYMFDKGHIELADSRELRALRS